MQLPFTLRTRRALRRTYRAECSAVSLDRYCMVGERILDVSPRGMFIAALDEDVKLDEVVAVRFRLPGDFEVNAEAEVSRIVRARRRADRTVGVGLRFTRLPTAGRQEILVRLAGYPPPIPARALRVGLGPLAMRTRR